MHLVTLDKLNLKSDDISSTGNMILSAKKYLDEYCLDRSVPP